MIIMKNSKNCIVYDWKTNGEEKFTKKLSYYSNIEFESLGFEHRNKLHLIYNSFKLFKNRNKYKKIICWQQMYGIFLAYFCNLFKVKKNFGIVVMTFIYKPKKNIIGKVYDRIFMKAVRSQYIEKIICYSKYECDFYANYFKTDRNKFFDTFFVLEDVARKYGKIQNKKYILDVGRSNRNHDLIIDVFNNTDINVQIIDSTFKMRKKCTNNIVLLDNIIYGDKLYEKIRDCLAVIVILQNPNISSGQTVFMQAMMFGKPIIVSKSNTIDSYVIDGYNGFVVNGEDEIMEITEKLLNNEKFYEKISKNSRKMYDDNFSFDKFSKSIADIIKE